MKGARLLEVAVVATLVAHGVAMLLMAGVLAPMLPGGPTHDDVQRVALIARHPWAYRVGWAGWQITAASDVLLAVALLRARFVPRGPAIAAAVLTALAVVPDQGAQALLVARAPDLAARAVATGDLAPFLAFEGEVFPLTAAWAACLYTLAAVAWTFCFAGAKTWTRALTWVSIVAWSVFAVASFGAVLPVPFRLSADLVAAGNAVGFLLLEVFLVLVAERVLRLRRPAGVWRAGPVWRHPSGGLLARCADAVAESRLARALFAPAPDLAFVSDVTDVVYVNYVVPAERLAALVPAPLELQRIGPNGEYALFTWLTYRHGRFAPRAVGPLRRLAASPVQSNWRVYVRDAKSGREGILFVTNAISSTTYALAARVLADGMPMHVWRSAAHRRVGEDTIALELDPGEGSAPDAHVALKRDASPGARTLRGRFAEAFDSWDAMLSACVPQDRAFSVQPWRGRMTRHEIHLGITPERCLPLAGEVRSRAATALVGEDAEPLCFLVERVSFRLDTIERDDLG